MCDVGGDGCDSGAFVSVDGLLAEVALGGFVQDVERCFDELIVCVTSRFV